MRRRPADPRVPVGTVRPVRPVVLASLAILVAGLAACGSGGDDEPSATNAPRESASIRIGTPAPPITTVPVTQGTTPTTPAMTSLPATTAPPATTTPPADSTVPPATEPTVAPTTSSAPPPGPVALGLPIPELGAGTTTYAVPTADPGTASWGDTHSSYPATDLFVPGDQGCGGSVTSPVSGMLIEVRVDDRYDADIDNPALRGGRSVTIVGDDGVRYYLAHFSEIASGLAVGGRVESGQMLGVVGDSGRTSACHIHFGISPPCPDREWSVRRGAIWPYPYLDAWRRGEQASPVEEIRQWTVDHPDACALAASDPNAGDA